MSIEDCFNSCKYILMEGALSERLKREYHMRLDSPVAIAGLVYSKKGREALYQLWREYIEIAANYNMPFIATTPTRRANKDRVKKSNYNRNVILDNVNFLKSVRSNFPKTEMYIGGLMGCKGDAYKADEILDRKEAEEFHGWQANLFRDAGVDFLYAGIMPALKEALGMADAMAKTGLPYIISFMLRNDGCLIDGSRLCDAIQIIDNSIEKKPLCFMTNCIHPIVVSEALSYDFNQNICVKERFRGIQANTSAMVPELLDGSEVLIGTEPEELAVDVVKLQNMMNISICGGCCGTDARHIEEIAKKLSKIN